MKLSKLLLFSLTEVFRLKKNSLFLVVNFSLGLIGFFLLQIFQQSLTSQTLEKSQIISGGDISVSARRSFSEAETKEWEKNLKYEKKSHFYNLFTMLKSGQNTQLVNVGVFDSQYPLYGQFKFKGAELSSEKPKIWLDPEVQDSLNVKTGQTIQVGDAEFEIAGIIAEDPSRLFRLMNFSPRVLIHQNYLASTQLIKPGSTLTETWFYKLPAGEAVQDTKKKLEEVITDPIVQIDSRDDSSRNSNQVLKYFTDYLGIVALVALGLCFLSGSYLLEWIFQEKKKNIAILKILGMSDRKILSIYLFQTFMISMASCLLCIGFVQITLPFLQTFLIEKFSLPIQLTLDMKSILIISLLGVTGPLLMAVPQTLQIFEQKALQLFQNFQTLPFKKNAIYFFWLVVTVVGYWLLAIWQSHSYIIASSFVGALIVMVLLLSFINRFSLYLLEKSLGLNVNWLLSYSVKGLTRRYKSTNLVFTTMSLATLILSLLPHVKSSILYEIKPQNSTQIPQLFLFDIQPEQVGPIQDIAKNILNAQLKMSPLVRSRILSVNNTPYERVIEKDGFQTREEEAEARFRNRGVNLTYSSNLQESETLVDGKFSGVLTPTSNSDQVQQLPDISLEEKYAERLKVKIGDQMSFDVQGIPIQAKVSSIRKVRWTSFKPNFFILFPTGVLEEAPQIFLTSVTQANSDDLLQFQNEVAQKFKNVSIVDVTKNIKSSLLYIEQMSFGLQLMAWMAVVVGLFVFIILLNTQLRERFQEMNLMQILGASISQIQKALVIQFSLLILTSVISGILFGLIAASLLMTFVFTIQTVYDFQHLLYFASFLILAAFVTVLIGLRPIKTLNPMDLIRQT